MRMRLRKNSWQRHAGHPEPVEGLRSQMLRQVQHDSPTHVIVGNEVKEVWVSLISFLAMTILCMLFISFLSSCNSKMDHNHMDGMEMTSPADSISGADLENFEIPSDDQKIISSLPTIHPAKKTMQQEIVADGTIAYDTRQERNIPTRYSGRIEKLYVKYMYQPVKQGEVLLEIYSPEMVTEQENLLFLLDDSSPDQQLISASKRKLMLLGLTETQIEQVIKDQEPLSHISVYSPYEGHIHDAAIMSAKASESKMNPSNTNELLLKEGMYVQKGQTLFNILNPHMVWAVLKIYSDDAAKIKLHQPVELTVEETEKKLTGRIDFIEPFFGENSKTLSVRVFLDNEYHALKVGMYVRASIEGGTVSGLWVPREAMLDLGKRKIVFLRNKKLFEAHEIKTGIASGNYIHVTEGLSEADEIAENAQFIQDSESFIK